ncbi:MAG: prolipoprotein diacylglyceryl transferase [Verrucomicrobiales bacterium]|jgi:phosphatidylglycerol:prolipoprotein diacylglycerol transferase|nr:prolipoprotein diacylglyceryl transferase [Verrucomicrobiales bacterium]
MLAYYIHNLDPFLIHFSGNWGVRYYGLAYILGFVAMYYGFLWFRKKGRSPLSAEQTADLLTWVVAGTLIGGRLGYCLLYDFHRTVADPLSVIAFWREGGISGMASHGGMAGVVIAVVVFARRQRVNFWQLADNLATVAPVGLFFGRLANFINGELWGRPATVPWAVIFPAADSQPRHPSQLYEALLEGAVLFVIMLWLRHKKTATGVPLLVFFVGYAVFRIVIECFREPDPQIGYYWGIATQGQLLSLALIILAGIFYRGKVHPQR